MVPLQAHGSVFTVRDFCAAGDTTGAAGAAGPDCWSGAGAAIGTGLRAAGLDGGPTGVWTTAGCVTGC
jgi:hypothetical protein